MDGGMDGRMDDRWTVEKRTVTEAGRDGHGEWSKTKDLLYVLIKYVNIISSMVWWLFIKLTMTEFWQCSNVLGYNTFS